MHMSENNKNNKTTIFWEVMKYSDKIAYFSITRWLSVFLRVLYFSYLIVCYRMVFLASIWGVIPIFLQTCPPISMKLTRNHKLKWKRKLSCQRLSFLAACKTSRTRQGCVQSRCQEKGKRMVDYPFIYRNVCYTTTHCLCATNGTSSRRKMCQSLRMKL